MQYIVVIVERVPRLINGKYLLFVCPQKYTRTHANAKRNVKCISFRRLIIIIMIVITKKIQNLVFAF